MDSLITAAGRSLAAGDALGALKRVGLRDDPPALALRGIAMAQLGDDAGGGGHGGRNAQANWKGKPRSNDTHASTTDPDARLFRKSQNTAAVMAFQGHVLMENRTGLVVGAVVTHADGMDERAAALAMLDTLCCRRSNTDPLLERTPEAGPAGDVRLIRWLGLQQEKVPCLHLISDQPC
jgi:hypothetical protein